MIDPMHSTYWGLLSHIADAIAASGDQKHTYQRRVDDTDGNAKWSWVFDVRKLHEVYEK